MKNRKPRISSKVTGVFLIGVVLGSIALALHSPVTNGTFGSFSLTQNPEQKNEINLSWTINGPTGNLELRVYRGAEELATLPGEATSYTHTESVYGIVRYTVAAFEKNTKKFLEDVYGLAYTGRLTWDAPTLSTSIFTEVSTNVWSTYLTQHPNAVLFDDQKGVEETSLANLDTEYEWFHDDVETLSIYCVGDPATVYVNPGVEYTHHGGFYVYLAEGPGDPYTLLPYDDPAQFSHDAGDVEEVSFSDLYSLTLMEGGKEYYFAVSTYVTVGTETLISALTEPVHLVEYVIEVAAPIYPPNPPTNFKIEF